MLNSQAYAEADAYTPTLQNDGQMRLTAKSAILLSNSLRL